MIALFHRVLTIREKVADKVGGKLARSEHIAHFVYAIALVTEPHAEFGFYQVSALGLGFVAIGLFFVGE